MISGATLVLCCDISFQATVVTLLTFCCSVCIKSNCEPWAVFIAVMSAVQCLSVNKEQQDSNKVMLLPITASYVNYLRIKLQHCLSLL